MHHAKQVARAGDACRKHFSADEEEEEAEDDDNEEDDDGEEEDDDEENDDKRSSFSDKQIEDELTLLEQEVKAKKVRIEHLRETQKIAAAVQSKIDELDIEPIRAMEILDILKRGYATAYHS